MAIRMDRQNDSLIAAFAVALSEERQKAGLTQEELADRADVSARFISFLETGRRQPSLSTLHALSLGLCISMQDLVATVERVHATEDNVSDN
jgi:transcriptional regulator with XRE-family HTH domain